MCGIAGYCGLSDNGILERMNRLMVHRGPDDHGVYVHPESRVGLSMQRLSILDLSGGHQPMSHADGRLWIVFNGEIFNAPELRRELEGRGQKFVTKNSDTEVLLQLYQVCGPEMLSRLNGMFAFVIHDREKGRLFGARDQLGIKPLYYVRQGQRFAFASELKCLLTIPELNREVDLQSLYHYLSLLYVPDEASIFKGIRRLPPGCCFEMDIAAQEFRSWCYWKPSFGENHSRTENDWVALIRDQLKGAVKRWTLSDVPIACSLSGGIDSSAIVGLLAEAGYGRTKTYSLGFAGERGKEWNETALARQVAEKWGTEHHEFFLEPDALLEDLVPMVWHLDEPYAGGLPSWYVFREMARDVKVGLTGTGGDELFGNYGKASRYERRRLVHACLRLRSASPALASEVARALRPLSRLTASLPTNWRGVGKGRAFSQLPDLLQQPFGRHYYALWDYFSDDDKLNLLREHTGQGLEKTSGYLQGLYDGLGIGDLRNGLAAVDLRTQLAEEFLFMTDRFSMAHSLEARVPFLDQQLVQAVFQIPPSMRADPLAPKRLLKRAVADLLPAALLTAPKRGFVIPVEHWLREKLRPLVESLLSPKRLQDQQIFRPDAYHKFIRPHLDGQANYTWQVWALLMFQLWHVVFLENKTLERPNFGWRDLI
ncbi:MAG: asparagine synthase (glutamine-hydrolyzing) [Verrucomicrobiota bacterium]